MTDQQPTPPTDLELLRVVLRSGATVDSYITAGSLSVEDDPATQRVGKVRWDWIRTLPALRYLDPDEVAAITTAPAEETQP